jgi:pantothenate kinase
MQVSDPWLLDQYDGITEYLLYDETEDRFAIKQVFDAETLIEANKALFNEGLQNRKSEFRKVASYPANAEHFFREMYGANPFEKGNEKLLERIVNDPELRGFRTLPGYVRIGGR